MISSNRKTIRAFPSCIPRSERV